MEQEFDPTLYGDDFFEQMSNLKFTDAEREIITFAMGLDDDKFSDEELFSLAYHFASTNGLNTRTE